MNGPIGKMASMIADRGRARDDPREWTDRVLATRTPRVILDGLPAMSQYAAVSLRTASGFVESLRDGREIWLGGERVVDVTAHPLLRGAALTIAALYSLQHRPDLQDRLSLPIDESGERIGYSHIQPRTRDDLRRRREMIKLWATAIPASSPTSRRRAPGTPSRNRPSRTWRRRNFCSASPTTSRSRSTCCSSPTCRTIFAR
jgi:4-hydroxyphenylacetate 3-hydroxylase N terminal